MAAKERKGRKEGKDPDFRIDPDFDLDLDLDLDKPQKENENRRMRGKR